MYYKYNKKINKVNILQESDYLKKLFKSEGVLYRKKTPPVVVEPAKEEILVPACDKETFYSSEEATYRFVDEGTLLVDGLFPITRERLFGEYEPFEDENGEVLLGMYRKINDSLVIKNPYGRSVVKVNQWGYVFEEGSSDCYLAYEGTEGKFDCTILTEKQLTSEYKKILLKK